MNENNKLGFWYSWPAIIITLCIFWPVGVYLIVKRVSKDRKAQLEAGKIIKYLGIGSYSIMAIGILACVGDGFGSDDIVMIVFFGAAGYALMRLSKNIITEGESVKQYLAIIINGNVRQLDSIAATTGKTYDVVHKDIKKMIEKNYLKNAYIDENRREIVLPSSTSVQNNTNSTQVMQESVQETKVMSKIVTCPCCGANNTIHGDMGECEYCGSPLK